MANSHELVLINCDFDSPEYSQTAVQAVSALISSRAAVVHASLAKNAVEVASDAFRSQKFDCFISKDWDPPRTSTSIFDYQIPNNEELASFASELDTAYESIDFDNEYIEAEENFPQRISAKMYEDTKGTKIVIAPGKVVECCLKTIGELSTSVPAIAILVVSLAPNHAVLRDTHASWSQIPVLPPPLKFAPQSSELPSGPPAYASRLLQERLPETLPELLESQVKELGELFSRDLQEKLQSSLLQCQRGGSDPSDYIVSNVTSCLTSLNDRFSASLGNLESRLRDVDAFKFAQKREIDTLLNEFRAISDQQKAIDELLVGIKGSVKPAVDRLEENLRKAEAEQEELKKNIEKATIAKTIASFPLSIHTVERKEDGSYFAVILNRKYYPVYGFIVLLGSNGSQYSSENSLAFSGVDNIDLTSLAALREPGLYEISVQHYADRSEICQRYRFSIQEHQVTAVKSIRAYQNSLVYQEVANVEEEVLKVRGETGVAMVRRLASDWFNEHPSLIGEFMQAVLDVSLGDEATVRQRLLQRGLRV